MNWVCSAGGPLIVASAEIARLWRGGFGRQATEAGRGPSGESISDYARACGVDGYLGTLRVGPGGVLVLGDEPMRTAFVSKPDGGVLTRWMYAENEADVQRAVEEIPESVWEATPHNIEVGQRGILVFDAAYPGDELPPTEDGWAEALWIHIELPPGVYLVDTADYQPDGSTRLILHRLRLSARGFPRQDGGACVPDSIQVSSPGERSWQACFDRVGLRRCALFW